MSLSVTTHTSRFDDLARDWAAVLDPSHPGAPFRSYAWASAWARQALGDHELHVLVARRGGRVVAILPLYSECTLLGGRRLRVVGDGIVGSDYVGIAARAADQPSAAAAFARHLAGENHDDLYLDGLLDGDPLIAALDGAFPGAVVTPRYSCPTVGIDGDFPRYLDALPDGTGAQFHRRRRWLQKQRGFGVELLQQPAELERGLEVLLDLHQERWRGASEAIDGAQIERFHLDALRGMARLGWARIYVLSVAGAPRAALYGFRHGDRFAFYQAGRDPAWQKRSVGTVLLGMILERCFAEGVAEFDFLHGNEPYKDRWAMRSRETVAVRAHGSGARAYVGGQARDAWQRCRRVLKTVLPSHTVDRLRQLRRLVGRAHG